MALRAIAEVYPDEEVFRKRKRLRQHCAPETTPNFVRCYPAFSENAYFHDVEPLRSSGPLSSLERVCYLLMVVCHHNDKLEEDKSTLDKMQNDEEELEQWLATALDAHFLSPEIVVVALVLLDRVQKAGAALTTDSVKMLLPTCVILASKFSIDERIFNADFLFMFENLCVDSVAQLESEVLTLLKWRVFVSEDVFREYHRAIFAQ